MASHEELIRAIDLAISGAWDEAHDIAQRHAGDPLANWLHAVLHKIEGDIGNSRYWYGRATGRDVTDFPDPQAELAAIRKALGA